MDLGEAVYRALTGGRSPHTEIGSTRDALEVLRADAGSTSQLARDLDVSRSTLRGWLSGRTPKADTGWIAEQARAVQRRSRLSGGRERRLRRAGMRQVKVKGTYEYASGASMKAAEDRTIDLGRYMDDVADELLDAFLDGAELHELAEIFHSGINDRGFYADTFDPNDPRGEWDITDLDWGWD